MTTDRQTNRQTDRQDKNNMPPIIRSRGIKIQNATITSNSLTLLQYDLKIKVCLRNTMPPAVTESEKAIFFSTKVKVKVTRSLTLESFERASLFEYARQIWSRYL